MRLLSVSHVVPSLKVTNDMVIEEVMRQSRAHLSWVERKVLATKLREAFEKCGTQVRYVRSLTPPAEGTQQNGERALELTVKAGQDALAKAGVKPEDVDLLIFTGVGRGWLEPAMANVFQSELGLKHATCFDIMDACAGWIRSMAVAQSFIDQGMYKTIMILNSEFNVRECSSGFEVKRLEDAYQLFAGYTIGEASTATLVAADGKRSNFYFTFKTWGDMYHLCQIPLPNAWEYTPDPSVNQRVPMVFYTAAKELLTFVTDKLIEHYQGDPQLVNQHYDIAFCHDVSDVSTEGCIQATQFDPNLVVRTHARFGNTVSASVPLAMSLALEDGRLRPGMKVLITVGSAGVSTAFCSFTYE